MQILILGNGFDLACGLPTTYNKFFEWRFQKIKEQCEGIETLLDSYREYFHNHFFKITYTKQDSLKNSDNDTVKVRKSYLDIYSEFKVIIQSMKNKQINFFDLYFIFNKKEKTNWNDVESEIFKIVTGISIYHTRNSEDVMKSIMPGGNYYKNYSNRLENTVIYDLFLLMFIEQCKVDSYLNIYEVLMKELKAFEAVFQKYISEITSKILEVPNFRIIYYENCKKLIKLESSTYIVNFNYTSVKEIIENQIKNMPNEINVHGRYDQITIFGIDQGLCNVDTDEYIFSKTYRKIAENTDTMMLPCKNESPIQHQELIFYGHSLAKADYSYFQSLFDLYDIYNTTLLTFKYSIYDENKIYEIKQEIFHKVTKLLIDYGSTMSNKDHGKNLLHKILLEGRLKVEEVTLDDMRFE